MYRDAVDQSTRNDIAAAAAVHRELGRDYDDAVAESLIDRIGAEIDKRVDARLGARSSRRPAVSSQSGKNQLLVLGGIAIGAGVTGLMAIWASRQMSPTNDTAQAIIWVWIILAAIGLGAVLARKYRERG
jgi:hypothetical protein